MVRNEDKNKAQIIVNILVTKKLFATKKKHFFKKKRNAERR